MKLTRLVTAGAVGLCLVFALGCEQKGPAEKAGEKIDETMEEVKESGESAADKAEEAIEEAGDEIKKSTE